MSKIIAGWMIVGDDELHFRDDDAQKKLEDLIVQEKGNSKTAVMSQAAATEEFDKLSEEISDETAARNADIAQERNRAVARENEIEGLFTMPTQEAVYKWLDEHPEATTTVQDNSLTIDKMVVGTLGYVTPEMFGAKGDGVNDDTNAIQMCIDYGRLHSLNITFVSGKKYKLSKSIKVYSNILVDGKNSTLICSDGPYGTGVNGYSVISTENDDNEFQDFTLKNVTIQMNRKTMHGCYFFSKYGCKNITIDKVNVYNPTWDGILCHGAISDDLTDTQPYMPERNSVRSYKISNCCIINELTDEPTRTGIMIENTFNAVVENCFIKGMHTGIHVEGSSEVVISNCLCVDNNNPYQTEDDDYHGDYMVGRSENVKITNCTARRIEKDDSFTYPDSTESRIYRSLYIPNPFMAGLVCENCTFIGGRVESDIGGTADYRKENIKFVSSVFENSNLVLNTTDNTQVYRNIAVMGCTFIGGKIFVINAEYVTITDCVFESKNVCYVDLENAKNCIINNNVFKGGDSSNSAWFKRSSLALTNTEKIAVENNVFDTDETFTQGSQTLCGYGTNRNMVFSNNLITRKSGFVIYVRDGFDVSESVIANNLMKYTSESSEKGIASVSTEKNTLDNNVIY